MKMLVAAVLILTLLPAVGWAAPEPLLADPGVLCVERGWRRVRVHWDPAGAGLHPQTVELAVTARERNGARTVESYLRRTLVRTGGTAGRDLRVTAVFRDLRGLPTAVLETRLTRWQSGNCPDVRSGAGASSVASPAAQPPANNNDDNNDLITN